MVVWLKCPVVGTGKNGDSYRPSIVDLPFFSGIGWSAVYYPDNPPYELCLVRAVIEEHLIPPTTEKYNADELKTFCDTRPHFKNRWLDQPHYPALKYEEKTKAMRLIDPVETRYFRSDKHTINTYTVYKLLTTNTASDQEFTKIHDEPAGGGWAYPFDTPEAASFITEQLGASQIDAADWTFHTYGKISSLVNVTQSGHQPYTVYRVTEDGTQTSLGTTQWTPDFGTSYSEQDVVWSCPETAVYPTDAIQMDGIRFRLTTSAGCVRTLYFRCGDGTYPSRITGFSWTEAAVLLSAGFISRQAASEELAAEFESGQDAQELFGEFVSRHLTSQELLGEFEARHDGSQELSAEFNVRHLASQEFLTGFDARHSTSRELGASFDGQVSLNLPAELITRQIASQELAAEFESGQDSEGLLGEFVVRHSTLQELRASFDGQVSLNLPAEFSSGRKSQQELIARFEVAQGFPDLPAGFLINQIGSQDLPAAINITHSLNLPSEFIIQRSTSANLFGEFINRRSNSEDLAASFLVMTPDYANLLGKFEVLQSFVDPSGVVLAYNPRAWFNYEQDIGTGFVSGIKPGSDRNNKAIGESSMGITTRYEEDRNDYITFGWKYVASQYPGGGGGGAPGRPGGYPGNTLIPRGSREVKGGFLVNPLPNIAADLRDFTSGMGWWIAGDDGFEAQIIPNADGTIDLYARGVSSSSYLGFSTYRTWLPTAVKPVTIVWEATAGAVVAGSGKYNSQTLGALCIAQYPYYPFTDAIFITYDGRTGNNRIGFVTVKDGQGETTDLTGIFNPEIKHKYKIVWYSYQVLLYVDNVLRATHTTRVPDIDLHFALSVEAVNDQLPPDTCEVTLKFNSFTPLL
jgi:hypothetical protein